MKTNVSPTPLPPLSVEALQKLHEIEDFVGDALENCNDLAIGIASALHDHNSPKRIERVLRTGLVAHLDVQIDYYSSLANYQPPWIVEILGNSVGSLLGLFPLFASPEKYRDVLLRTAAEHIKTRPLNLPKSEHESSLHSETDRKTLREHYLASFPDDKVKILDICWAAGQHYREWKRWLKKEVKDGSTPDLAFRRILTSGKRPEEFKKKPRPSGWQ